MNIKNFVSVSIRQDWKFVDKDSNKVHLHRNDFSFVWSWQLTKYIIELEFNLITSKSHTKRLSLIVINSTRPCIHELLNPLQNPTTRNTRTHLQPLPNLWKNHQSLQQNPSSQSNELTRKTDRPRSLPSEIRRATFSISRSFASRLSSSSDGRINFAHVVTWSF